MVKPMNEFTLRIIVEFKQENSALSAMTKILQNLVRKTERMGREMATVAEAIEAVKAAATEEREEVLSALTRLREEVQALRDQIANGTQVTDEQLAELSAAVEGVLNPEDVPA